MLFMNIRSVPKYHEGFFSHFVDYDFDTIGFCETRLTHDIESLYLVPNYAMFCNHRSRNGGGLVLYIKKSLMCKESISYHNDIFLLHTLISCDKKTLIIVRIIFFHKT